MRGYFVHMTVEAVLQHKARIPFQASTVMDQVPHLTAATRKAFASLRHHLSDELYRRKQLPRQL